MLDHAITLVLRASAPPPVSFTRSKLFSKRHVAGVTKAARKRLSASAYSGLRSVSCEHRDGTLVLRGRVSSYYQKQLAQEAVRNLPGVVSIVNAVEVVAPKRATERLKSTSR